RHNDPTDNERVMRQAATLLELDEYEHHTWARLSEGFRMRAAIAAATLASPTILILDEPLAPLDPDSQQSLLAWTRAYARAWRQLAIVVSSQHVAEIESIANSVLVLR